MNLPNFRCFRKGPGFLIMALLYGPAARCKRKMMISEKDSLAPLGGCITVARSDRPRCETYDRGDRLRGQDHPPSTGGRP